MLRLITLLLGATIAVPAFAQTVPQVNTINPSSDLIQIVPNGQVSSQSTFTTPTNLFSNGAQLRLGAVQNPDNSTTQPLFIGKNAGAAFSLSGADTYSSLGIGAGSLQSLTGLSAENTCVGTWSCQYVTTGNLLTGIGMHSLGSTTTGPGHTALGNDAMRNSITPSGYVTAVGQGAGYSGNHGVGATFVGAQAMKGNASAVKFTGSLTNGDVMTVTVSSSFPGIVGSPATATHTVNSGSDTFTSIATDLASQLNLAMTSPSYSMFATGVGANISFQFPGDANGHGWAATVSYSVTGSATETGTVVNGLAGQQDVAVGDAAMECLICGAVNDNTAVGFNAGLNMQSGTFNTFIGSVAGGGAGAAANAGTGSGNVFIGARTGWAYTTGAHNTLVGQGAGTALTTASNVTILGQGVGASSLTTASDVILIGNANTLDTSTAHSLTIQGDGTTASLNCTGINSTPSCGFPGGSLAIGVVGTAPTVTSGAGAPSSTQPNGSLYLRTDGGANTRVYISEGGGTWTPISSS